MALPGMARPTTACPKSPSRSQARSGMVRASLGSETKMIGRRTRFGHEDAFGQTGPLRDLYEGLYRARAGPGVQLARRAIRRRLCLYQKPGPCRLDAYSISVR